MDSVSTISLLRSRAQRRFVWALVLLTTGLGIIIELVVFLLPEAWRHSLLVRSLTAWPLALLAAYLAARRFAWLAREAAESDAARIEALSRARYLQATNALLHAVASSIDITRTFRTLAGRIREIVECDAVGIALLTEDGQELRTFSANVGEGEYPDEPPLQTQFARTGTLMSEVIAAGKPRIEEVVPELALRYLDVTVAQSVGMKALLLMPLVYDGQTIGTLNLLSRQPNAFEFRHVDSVAPIAETLAVAHATQKLSNALARSEMAQALANSVFAAANEIQGAAQTIIGLCDLLGREHPDPQLQRDLGTIVQHAKRLSGALEQLQESARSPLEAGAGPRP